MSLVNIVSMASNIYLVFSVIQMIQLHFQSYNIFVVSISNQFEGKDLLKIRTSVF